MTDHTHGEHRDEPILVVEDEPRLVQLIRTLLEARGHRVVVARSGGQAIELAALESPRLILLDVKLPDDIDGFTVLRRVREFSGVPIIMLTARTLERDKLEGFELGADDYITKPFSARELLARVQAVLRRTESTTESQPVITSGRLMIDLAAHQVSIDGDELHLTPTEYRLLLVLARHANRVIPHTTLLTEVWGVEFQDQVDYLRTYIRYLRRKLEPDRDHPRVIRNKPGIGYYLSTESHS